MTDANPNVLEVRGAVKSYGPNQALKGVDIHVAAGEFVVLLGPNGAGKSTLFQLLTGLFAADQGDIFIAGKDMRRESVSALAQIGIVFQQPALDLELSVTGNLMFHARLHGIGGKSKSLVQDALAKVGLTDISDKQAKTLSGGNRRKVELARSLVHRPRLLLMDEATVGLDPASRQQLLRHVRQLCREDNVGVLWATHLVDEAEGADRVIVLNHGKKINEGSPAELLAGGGKTLTEILIDLSEQNDAASKAGGATAGA